MKNERIPILAFTFFLAFCAPSRAQVVFVDRPGQPLVAQQRLEHACLFYGLHVSRVGVANDQASVAIRNVFERNDVRAIVITGRALSSIDVNDIKDSVAESHDKKISVLIVEIPVEVDPNALRTWSGDPSLGCASTESPPTKGYYCVSGAKDVSRQLGGLEFPVTSEKVDYLTLDNNHAAQILIRIRRTDEEAGLPIFARVRDDELDAFLLTRFRLSGSSARLQGQINIDYFLELAPLMMFLRYSCRELCWQSPGQYANLTIDDPWLTEPYGFLSYKGLLKQMDEANFHLTVAFIPWNYDRNETALVSLFKDRPDRFSLCFHGNDHDHYEFYKYETTATDPRPAVPLDAQEVNLKQAIARMERFRDITGLAYDRVMVFPHGIAPAETLGLLKKYNFLATSNGRNVPLGSNEPNDVLFSFRPVTLAFQNFASLDRDPADTKTKLGIAVELFLGNPLILYSHHGLFKDGIDTFNETAEIVNGIEPATEWRGLEYIARHSYLEKIRSDGTHEIRSFCRSIEIENATQQEVVYHVRKEETFSPPVRQVTVNGRPCPYEKSKGDISVTTAISAKETSIVEIIYENDPGLKSIDIAKSDRRVRRLRKLSDFRDITLSRSKLGRIFTSVYYKARFDRIGLKRLAVICFVMMVVIILGTWRVLRGLTKRRREDLQTHDTTHQ
jgi:vacuolar-type H+-ATPase subunit F/Vma7